MTIVTKYSIEILVDGDLVKSTFEISKETAESLYDDLGDALGRSNIVLREPTNQAQQYGTYEIQPMNSPDPYDATGLSDNEYDQYLDFILDQGVPKEEVDRMRRGRGTNLGAGRV